MICLLLYPNPTPHPTPVCSQHISQRYPGKMCHVIPLPISFRLRPSLQDLIGSSYDPCDLGSSSPGHSIRFLCNRAGSVLLLGFALFPSCLEPSFPRELHVLFLHSFQVSEPLPDQPAKIRKLPFLTLLFNPFPCSFSP